LLAKRAADKAEAVSGLQELVNEADSLIILLQNVQGSGYYYDKISQLLDVSYQLWKADDPFLSFCGEGMRDILSSRASAKETQNALYSLTKQMQKYCIVTKIAYRQIGAYDGLK